jgi:hypothetical protein
MNPINMPRTLPSRKYTPTVTVTSHTRAVPVIAVPARLPTAPMAKASNTDTTPTVTEAIALVVMTRFRCGINMNVVSPLRWVHSLVTARIAIIGRMTATGNLIAETKVE